MNRILKIGMDVHSKSFSLCALEPVLGADDHIFATTTVPADYHNVTQFINNLLKKLGSADTFSVECGYEAGCLGYSLYRQLEACHVKCSILAPSTMLTQNGKRIKTDSRDAKLIAKCLAYNTYHRVHVPTKEDNEVKEYIRMRDAHKVTLKRIKQQIGALCLRYGYSYPGTNWTQAHLKWLRGLPLSGLLRETLNEYLASYDEEVEKIKRFDKRIEELADGPRYREIVKHLCCLSGIKTHTALSLITETGDFNRFAKGNTYAAYLGLTPGEHSSGEGIHHLGISKAGNTHLRRLLIESAKAICRGAIGYKSKALKARQAGNPSDVIAYADRANVRLRSKYYRMIRHGKKRNVAVAAIARELACFVWGMATGHIKPREAA